MHFCTIFDARIRAVRCFLIGWTILMPLATSCPAESDSATEKIEVKFVADPGVSEEVLTNLTSGTESAGKRDIYFL
jgi:hypothetical protein